ncbi:MAG: metal-dependent hydrolase [Scytolyngbya sp. HA4215-MV1]|nr:metal-dependent hydrolase [Scytolyngbya sp. HA4215-MV1]
MMSITHACIAAAGTSLILGTANPIALSLAIVGSQLPDIDTTTSAIGQICYPLSHWIEDRFPHRSITHSLLATVGLTVVSVSIGWMLGQVWIAIALPLGHLLACFSDTFTKQGVQLFYPYPAWAVSVSNPRRRLKTGGASELWVLGGAIATLILALYIATGGGITQQFSHTLGMREGAIELYNQKASTHHIWAEVRGVWASDRRRADGRYWIVANEGNEFIVSDGKGFYKTGQQLIAERFSASAGAAATTQSYSLSFNDEEVAPKLQEVAAAVPGALMLVTGQLVIDAPESVQAAIAPNQLQTLGLSGNTVTMVVHPMELALVQLRDQYGVGTLMVRVVSPRPQ